MTTSRPPTPPSSAAADGGHVRRLALVAIAAVATWGWRKNDSMYHLAVEDGVVQVMHGVSGSLLGMSLHSSPVRVPVGLQRVKLPDPRRTGRPWTAICWRRRISPSGRAQLDGLPADSYDEIRGQIGRLADQALPVCLTVEARPGEGDAPADEPAEGSSEAPTAATSEAADGGTGSEPGVNCREVRR